MTQQHDIPIPTQIDTYIVGGWIAGCTNKRTDRWTDEMMEIRLHR
jgi:hypothetical protein